MDWSPQFSIGEFAPAFSAPSPSNPGYHFTTAAGRYVLLGFMPRPGPARDAAFAAFAAHQALFDDDKLTAFLVLTDEASIAQARNHSRGLRWFLDGDRAVSRLYGAVRDGGPDTPFWLLLDPFLRVLAQAPLEDAAAILATISALPPVADHAGTPLHAPVLIVPRVFEPELCQELIAFYGARGGDPSGVMRQVGQRTIGVMDGFKSRRDVTVDDPALRGRLMRRLARRLAPEMAKVFQFHATRIERYTIACYDAQEGGFFRPHRDNETLGTAHRQFACSINLNAEDFEGGDLRFPEFGPRTYRPPTGGAVIFSCSLQHEATPVTRGRRYAFLPFFYDEAGARIRMANAGTFAPTEAPAAE